MDQAGFRLTELGLPLPAKHSDKKRVLPLLAELLFFFFFNSFILMF